MPVLAINGSLDRQVLAAENLAGIAAALADNRESTMIELPGLNHLFQTARTGAIGEYAGHRGDVRAGRRSRRSRAGSTRGSGGLAPARMVCRRGRSHNGPKDSVRAAAKIVYHSGKDPWRKEREQ